MFRHILIPTDGSRLALRGVKAGVALAKALDARVTLLHVIPPYIAPYDALSYLTVTAADHRRACARNAKTVLDAAAREARKAGVRCAKAVVTDLQPWGGILRAAQTKKCDAIAIASRGHGALAGMMLGSETQRVLARARIPVLVVTR
jgi:nucleotide-binding universal stress UspA family protein